MPSLLSWRSETVFGYIHPQITIEEYDVVVKQSAHGILYNNLCGYTKNIDQFCCYSGHLSRPRKVIEADITLLLLLFYQSDSLTNLSVRGEMLI